MENNFWQYWNLETTAMGRQRWKFSPPIHITDWNTEEANRFLADMQKSFVFDKSTNPNSADKVYRSKHTPKLSSEESLTFARVSPCSKTMVP